jgi:hypothetical protein
MTDPKLQITFTVCRRPGGDLVVAFQTWLASTGLGWAGRPMGIWPSTDLLSSLSSQLMRERS